MITVLTAAYNRAYIIHKLYDSLKRQTCKNFEWIVIDDGSTDNTEKIFSTWIKEDNPFRIIYKKTDNGGKHRACNIGTKMAHGDCIICIDSDDYLTDDAIEFIEREFGKIADDDEFAGIICFRCSGDGKNILSGNVIFEPYKDGTFLDAGSYGITGDTVVAYKTNVLLKYPYPEFPGEKYFAEGIIFNKIAMDGLKSRFFSHVVQFTDYLSDGLTRNALKNIMESPLGWVEGIVQDRIISPDDGFRRSYFFYEMMHDKYTKEKMCEVLQIEDSEYDNFREIWEKIMSNVQRKLAGKEIFAIYGMGLYASRLKFYLDNLGIKIAYVIDRNSQFIDFKPAYNMEMDLPKADSICITLKNIPQGIAEKIKQKCPSADVWSINELGYGVW